MKGIPELLRFKEKKDRAHLPSETLSWTALLVRFINKRPCSLGLRDIFLNSTPYSF